MATETPPTTQSADAPGRTKTPAVPAVSRDLLTRPHFGLHVTGRVDSISAIRHSQGNTGKGKPYSFWQQTMTVAAAGQMFEIGFRADTEPKGALVMYELDEAVRIKVGKPRIFNGQVSFDAVD